MPEYTIDVSKIEELQMTSGIPELEKIFLTAQSTIVQGLPVILERKNADGSFYKFDELTTEADLATYKETVFKYL